MLTRNFIMFFIYDLISITIKPANIKKHKLQIQHKKKILQIQNIKYINCLNITHSEVEYI
jgi:hypothetical protein